MKNYLQVLVLFIAFLLLIPSIALFGDGKISANEKSLEKVSEVPLSADISEVEILITASGEVVKMPIREYIIASVMAQMPSDFEPEALKAQAVMAHTYALKRHLLELENPHAELKGADFSDDFEKYQAFFTEDDARAFYGDEYDRAHAVISKACEEVLGEVCTYDGEPIVVAFHSVSGGVTESANSAWSVDVPYLQSVDSSFDLELDGAITKVSLSEAEVKARLTQAFAEGDFSGDPEDWIRVARRTESGYVNEVLLGETGLSVSGAQIASILNLRSAMFEFDITYNVFNFHVKGSGHLVGLSQYGANHLAEEGYSYEEILKHYFRGIEVGKFPRESVEE